MWKNAEYWPVVFLLLLYLECRHNRVVPIVSKQELSSDKSNKTGKTRVVDSDPETHYGICWNSDYPDYWPNKYGSTPDPHKWVNWELANPKSWNRSSGRGSLGNVHQILYACFICKNFFSFTINPVRVHVLLKARTVSIPFLISKFG